MLAAHLPFYIAFGIIGACLLLCCIVIMGRGDAKVADTRASSRLKWVPGMPYRFKKPPPAVVAPP